MSNTIKRKSKIILLQSKESYIFGEDDGTLTLYKHLTKSDGIGSPISLYILSDDEILENDYYIHTGISPNTGEYQTVNQCYKGQRLIEGKEELFVDGMFAKDCKKIIATTDVLPIGYDTEHSKVQRRMCQPSIQFVTKFIESWNKSNIITDVMIEYELLPNISEEYYDATNITNFRLKINSKDNTITITQCKNSWSRGEVIELLDKMAELSTDGYINSFALNQFKEQNL